MIASVKSGDISRGIKACVNAIELKDDLHKCIQFEAENDTLQISASNALYSVQCSCNANIEEDGFAVVDGKTVYNVISKANDNCKFKANDRNMVVNARGKTTIPNMGKKIPLVEGASGKSVTCDSVEFKNAVNKIHYAISEDQSRLILTGAHIVTDGSFATITALDGFRLAQTAFACSGDAIDVVVPSKALAAACDPIISGEMRLSTNGSRMDVAYDNFVLHAQLLAGKYVDTDRIMPNDFRIKVLARTADIRDMIESATIASGKNNLVKMSTSKDKLLFSSNSETATFEGDIDALVDGDDIDIAFNLKYLSNAISHIPTEQCVIRMNSGVSPAILAPHMENVAPDIHLLLPVRVFAG